jgi:hypothetical protein
VDTNQFWGTIPSEFATSSRLTTFNVGCDRLHGSIPTEFGLSSTLQTISLQFNKLTGTLPTGTICQSRVNVSDVQIATTSMVRSRPSSDEAFRLKLSMRNENNFTGRIPARARQYGQPARTSTEWKRSQQDPIPSQLGELVQLQQLSVVAIY